MPLNARGKLLPNAGSDAIFDNDKTTWYNDSVVE